MIIGEIELTEVRGLVRIINWLGDYQESLDYWF